MITSHDRDLYHDEYQYHYWCQYYHCPLLLSLLLLFWKNHYFHIFSLSLNLSLKPCLRIGNRVLRRNKCEKGKLTNDKDTLILGPTPRVENHKTFRKNHPHVDVTSSGFSTSLIFVPGDGFHLQWPSVPVFPQRRRPSENQCRICFDLGVLGQVGNIGCQIPVLFSAPVRPGHTIFVHIFFI